MAQMSSQELVRRWWDAVDRADFDAAVTMISPDAVIDWPLSNERMANPDSWRLVNQHDPGRWRASIHSILADGEMVVTDTSVTDGSIAIRAVSFFTVRNGVITNLVEYWPEPYAAPGWRSEWVESIPAAKGEPA